jgi:15-cis-phytoene desaturase
LRPAVAAADRVPGEHGFRFFPSFYRHMFDTMQRIPIAEAAVGDDGTFVTRDSARSVFDALRSAEAIELGLAPDANRGRAFEIPRRPMRSPQEIRRFFAGVLERAGYRGQDLYRLATRYAEYLTSSPERRAREYEHLSWAQFLGLDDGGFSGYFGRHVTSGAQALVAMSSKTNDARTIGSIAVQLTLDQVRADPGGRVDATLRGPTSVALFGPWQAYLQSAGVTFTCARLVGFQGHGMAVRPAFAARASAAATGFTPVDIAPADYYVLTLPVDGLQSLFDADGAPAAAWARGGAGRPPELLTREQLLAANRSCLELDGHERYLDDDDIAKYLAFPVGDFANAPDRGPLRYMCGIQFYFAADVKTLVGHTICLDSPWGVSYISQAQYWQARSRGRGGLRGVLSAIFTLFEVPAPGRDGRNPKTALECSEREIAERVWKQIADTWNVERHGPLPEPDAFYLDESLSHDGRRWTNRTPYLVNRVGDWEKRGGARLPGGDYAYRLQLGHTVFAGAFMRTQTRLNTMEAANESARRAVNAILRADGASIQRCPVWNVEDHEIPELLPLRELDERIYRRGGHHLLRHGAVEGALRAVPWDLLRLGLPTGGLDR